MNTRNDTPPRARTEPRASARAVVRRRATIRSLGIGYLSTGIVLTISPAVSMAPAIAVVRQPPAQQPEKRDSDLSRKLIDKAASNADEDVMATIMRMMRDVVQRLEIRFDPGDETQGAQRQIVEKLDEAIKTAAARRRPIRSRSTSASADKRRMPKPGAGKTSQPDDAQPGVADDSAGNRPADAAKPATASDRRGEMRETRRTWGNLPMRDRDEIIQGVGEQFLERYRAWIERYYRALQESDE